MFPIYIIALLLHAAYSTTPCKDGVEIVSKETKDPTELIGNWAYVYHWDNFYKFKWEFADDNPDHVMNCPKVSIEAVTPEYVKAKEDECGDSEAPFKWTDAKLKIDAPSMGIKGGILFMEEEEIWIMKECKNIIPLVLKKVSEDYMLLNPQLGDNSIFEMIARKTPTLEELKCVASNVDVGKGMLGFGLCN